MKKTIVIEATRDEFAKAFTEWERRYREEPERFMSDVVRYSKHTPRSYGELCEVYFRGLLDELAQKP